MVKEFDPLDEPAPTAPDKRSGGGLLDLPLGGDEPAAPAAERPATPPPWRPRHERRRHERRPRRGGWWLPLLLLVVAAGGWWLWPRGAPARAVVSAEELDFGTRTIAGEGEPLELRIGNGGERPLRIRRLELAGPAAELFSVAAEACVGRRLAAGEECLAAVDYRPRVSGSHEAALRLVARAENAPLELPLRGRGVAPRLVVEPAAVEFDPLPIGGRSPAATVELASAGDAPLELGEIAIAGDAAADFRLERDRCSGRTVEPGRDCGLRLAFVPSAEGERRARLSIASSSVDGLVTVALAGSGLPAPEVALAPSRLVFGEQLVGGRSAARKLSLTNRGRSRLELGAARLAPDGGAFKLTADSCSRRALAPGAGCVLEVVFAPGVEGEAARRVELPQAGGTGLAWSAELAGTGVAPRLEWSAQRLEWSEERVGTAAPARELRLANRGSGALRLESLRLGGSDADAFVVTEDRCSQTSLDPGESCTLTVGFRPRRLGEHTATLTAAGPALRGDRSAELSGSGSAGRLEVGAERLEFGSVRVTEATTREVTLGNAGNAALTLRGFTAAGDAAGDFRVAGSCRAGAALEPGESCELVVRFSPLRPGGRVAQLEVVHDGVGGSGRLGLSGAALPPPVGELDVEPASLPFGQVPVGQRSAIVSLTLSNDGPGPVSVLGFELRGRDAGDFRLVPGSCEGIPYLAARGRCGVGVRFLPQAPGERRAVLVIRHNAPGGERQIALTGYGLSSGGLP